MPWTLSPSNKEGLEIDMESYLKTCTVTKLVKLLDRGWITKKQFDKEMTRRFSK